MAANVLVKTMKTHSLDDALGRVLRGETAAYAVIVRAHQHDIWRVVSFALRDRAGTEDLVQQVFVQAYARLDRFERGRDLGAWLRGIARNLVRQELRERARRDRRLISYQSHLEAIAAADREADAREEALRRALAECSRKLPDVARQALELRYREALDFTTVAAALGRTVAGARQLLQRVRMQLRHCIREELAVQGELA